MLGELAVDCLLGSPPASFHRVFVTSSRRFAALGGRWSNAWLAEQGDRVFGSRTIERAWPSAACNACGGPAPDEAARAPPPRAVLREPVREPNGAAGAAQPGEKRDRARRGTVVFAQPALDREKDARQIVLGNSYVLCTFDGQEGPLGLATTARASPARRIRGRAKGQQSSVRRGRPFWPASVMISVSIAKHSVTA